jgi:hypothetical protein
MKKTILVSVDPGETRVATLEAEGLVDGPGLPNWSPPAGRALLACGISARRYHHSRGWNPADG